MQGSLPQWDRVAGTPVGNGRVERRRFGRRAVDRLEPEKKSHSYPFRFGGAEGVEAAYDLRHGSAEPCGVPCASVSTAALSGEPKRVSLGLSSLRLSAFGPSGAIRGRTSPPFLEWFPPNAGRLPGALDWYGAVSPRFPLRLLRRSTPGGRAAAPASAVGSQPRSSSLRRHRPGANAD